VEWVRENWVFIIFFILFVAMHLSGHGCMGGHRKHGKEEEGEEHKDHQGKGSSEKKKGGHGCC